jgi:hypothetical protein
MIKQFIEDVYWRDLDYLIIDTPPGTSDEHITVVENIKKCNPDGAILVTTPQVCLKFTGYTNHADCHGRVHGQDGLSLLVRNGVSCSATVMYICIGLF